MIRNLKALGLAFVAVFAMSAIVASAAQAQLKVTVAPSPAYLTTDSIGKQVFTINPKGAEPANLECSSISGHATVKNGDTSITFTEVGYSGCAAKIGASTLPVTIDMEKCDYKFHGGKKGTEVDHFIEGEVDLVCPAGVTGPVITIFSDAEHKTRICKYTTWNFVNQKQVTYKNTTGTTDDVDLRAIGVPVGTTRNEGILCPKPVESSVYNGEVTVTGFEDLGVGPPIKEGKSIGVTISE